MKDLMALRTVALVLFAKLLLISGERCGDPTPDGREGNCTCANSIMDCRQQGYKSFPQKIESDIKAIYLNNNGLTTLSQIPEEAELHTLVLTNNAIEKLEFDAFDNLDNLKTLYLSNNSISTIEDDIFEWNPLKLEVLHLDGNKLEFIQHFLFYDLEELTDLYLQNNQITFIHPHAFLQLKNLRNLRLDGNRLHTFNHKWIEKLEANGFATLRFDRNEWSCDCAMKNSMTWLRNQMKDSLWFHELTTTYPIVCTRPHNVDQKVLSSLSDEELSTCDMPKIIGISAPAKVDSGRDVLLRCVYDEKLLPVPTVAWTAPNKDIYRLNTANNFDGIEVHQDGSLLIRNLNKTTDNGKYTCTVTNMKGSFNATTQLTVKDKPAPTPVPGHTLATQTPQDLRTASPNNSFPGVIHKACAKGCQCISRHVDCAGDGRNPVYEIPVDIPTDALTINFASNGLSSLGANDFSRFKDLEELRLDNNKISSIDSKAFLTLTGLTTLTLQENELTEIAEGTFEKLESLNVLVLDKNRLTKLNGKLFKGLVNLQWLYIRHNFIKIIGTEVFAPLTKIKFIHLEQNQIGVIYPEVIDGLINKNPVTIKKFFVDDNPFTCDCNMEGLRKRVRGETGKIPDDFFGDGVKCSYPPEHVDKMLVKLKAELRCKIVEQQGSGKNDVPQQSGSYSGLLLGGIAVGVVLTIVITILWRKYGRAARTSGRSYNYSNLNGDDESEKRGLTDNLGNSGTEAFV